MWLCLLVSSLDLGKGTMPTHTKLLPGCVTYAAAILLVIASARFFSLPSLSLLGCSIIEDFAWACCSVLVHAARPNSLLLL